MNLILPNRRGGRSQISKAAVLLAFCLSLSLLFFTGCISWNTADGTRHTLILGFGLVSGKTTPDNSAAALRSHTLGLLIQGAPHGGVALGYHSLQQTSIAPGWQGVLAVSAGPGQPLTVDALPAGYNACPPTDVPSQDPDQH